ncbi:MAG: MFS transporter, partial [Thermoanaerobaculia bacterium]
MPPSAGYLELLRANRDFRRLWIGEMASLLGDWLNTIALYTLIRQLTGSPVALGLVFIVKTLPFALASPLAGLLADRFDRKRLMIAADLARAVVVLGFLVIDTEAELPLLYGLIALQMMISAVFVPARSAALPNITTPRELLTANALSAATWSVLLAVGAAVGGFATEGFGTATVFVLDSASYLVSAAFLAGVRVPPIRGATGPVRLGRALSEIA